MPSFKEFLPIIITVVVLIALNLINKKYRKNNSSNHDDTYDWDSDDFDID